MDTQYIIYDFSTKSNACQKLSSKKKVFSKFLTSELNIQKKKKKILFLCPSHNGFLKRFINHCYTRVQTRIRNVILQPCYTIICARYNNLFFSSTTLSRAANYCKEYYIITSFEIRMNTTAR